MGCNCRKAGVDLAVDPDAPPPDDFPATDPDGSWIVTSTSGAVYAFASLASARTAADMIGGKISSA